MDRLDARGATLGGNWVCYGGTNDDDFGITRSRRGEAAADGILEFPSMGGWRARVARRTRRCLDVAISRGEETTEYRCTRYDESESSDESFFCHREHRFGTPKLPAVRLDGFGSFPS